ncbi:MAG TPA: hypothetical protein VE130_05180 [Nitrososphaeraceae archaeon]|nr:hypothetical protein [Nitrososphaeraceae archaeon]
MAITPTLLTTHSVSATVDISSSVKEKKDAQCNGERHTISYCDGFAAGKQDREHGNDNRCDSKSHTSKWRSGYKAGYQNC